MLQLCYKGQELEIREIGVKNTFVFTSRKTNLSYIILNIVRR